MLAVRPGQASTSIETVGDEEERCSRPPGGGREAPPRRRGRVVAPAPSRSRDPAACGPRAARTVGASCCDCCAARWSSSRAGRRGRRRAGSGWRGRRSPAAPAPPEVAAEVGQDRPHRLAARRRSAANISTCMPCAPTWARTVTGPRASGLTLTVTTCVPAPAAASENRGAASCCVERRRAAGACGGSRGRRAAASWGPRPGRAGATAGGATAAGQPVEVLARWRSWWSWWSSPTPASATRAAVGGGSARTAVAEAAGAAVGRADSVAGAAAAAVPGAVVGGRRGMPGAVGDGWTAGGLLSSGRSPDAVRSVGTPVAATSRRRSRPTSRSRPDVADAGRCRPGRRASSRP